MTAHGAGRRWLPALCVLGILLFTALGAWQVQRLGWKRALIERVEARIQAEPVDAPAAAAWSSFDAQQAEYRKVRVRGVFMHDHETQVDALTALGAGAWVLTPLRTADGVILVNRGFAPPGWRNAIHGDMALPAGEVTVTGLLRPTEPDGRLLRPNDPAADRWFSRDVAAIAAARNLRDVAPFFIDADAASSVAGGPVGGLTVVQFRNAHLAYAATWFGLAGLCVAGLVMSGAERRVRGKAVS